MEVHGNTSSKSRTYSKPLERGRDDTGKGCAHKTWHSSSRVGAKLFVGKGGIYAGKYTPRADHNKRAEMLGLKPHDSGA